MVQELKSITLNDLTGMHREIAEVIGIEPMLALCNMYGGNRIMIPTLYPLQIMVRNRNIVGMKKAGKKGTEIAKKYGLTREAVYHILKKAGVDCAE